MATIATSTVQPSPVTQIPPLQNGDNLTRDEFERRYDAATGLKAELIEGVVYMAPPGSIEGHCFPHADILGPMYVYRASTPGVRVGDNGSIRMDLDNMPQPDAFMVILPSHGGKAKTDREDYLVGSPELISEIAATSASYDLHKKLAVYRRNGVREYIVWRTFDRALDYFILRGSEYIRHASDEQGRFKSEVFPGLWLDAKKLIDGDAAAVLKFVQEGIASPQHAEFAAKLQAAAQPK